jgi:hypothetical protein
MCLLSDGTAVLELTFDNPKEGRELLSPYESSWSEWLETLERRPSFVGIWSGPEVCGYSGADYRIGGWFVEPVESVVGLRPYDDVLEGTLEVEELGEPVPYAIFEVEKIVRMMLRQSALALEVLSAPIWIRAEDRSEPCGTSRGIVRRALSAEIVEAYRERTAAEVDEESDQDAICAASRRLATCVALGVGRVSCHLRRALETIGEDGDPEDLLPMVSELRLRLDETAEVLPKSPTQYKALDEWLVDRRLERRRDDESA